MAQTVPSEAIDAKSRGCCLFFVLKPASPYGDTPSRKSEEDDFGLDERTPTEDALLCKVFVDLRIEGGIMEYRDAAAQIDLIWAQIVRTECFRGYRPTTVAATGLFGLAAAAMQPWLIPAPELDPEKYIRLWSWIAVVSVALTLLEVAWSYLRSESQLERRLTCQALQQFFPSLLGGAIITWMISAFHPQSVVLLPGLWAICFGLGIFASIPFVTHSVIWIACYYLAAGTAALMFGRGASALSPWQMGGTFGLGQLLMASVLYFAETKQHAKA